MQATLTWIDLTASDRDKMRRVLDLFKEQGTLDEMGLGSLRDALSDALFPGTSSIQTRLRIHGVLRGRGPLAHNTRDRQHDAEGRRNQGGQTTLSADKSTCRRPAGLRDWAVDLSPPMVPRF